MLHQRERFLMGDEHVDHPVLQHLERTDRGAELLSGLGVFQRRRVQLADRADRFGAERADRAITARFQRGYALAFLAQQLAAHVAQADFGGATTVDGPEALQIQTGGAAIHDEQADAASILALARGAGGDDQIVRPGRRDNGRLLAGQDIVLAVAPRRRRDVGEVEARALFGPGQRPDRLARDDVGDKRLLLLFRSRPVRSGRPPATTVSTNGSTTR